MKISIITILATFFIYSCNSEEKPMDTLKGTIQTELDKTQGDFAVAYLDLTSGDTLLINAHETFHAASTMKTPVMIEVYKQANAGLFSLTDSIEVINSFKSIVDGSEFTLTPEEDSETSLYEQIGHKLTIATLTYAMIIESSNLATNVVIEKVDPKKVTATMRELGAPDIEVLRGVEDIKAYEKGMSNTTTAYDLMVIFSRLAKGEVVNEGASAEMIDILLDQKFNTMIPAHLPTDVRVAHKTGFISGLHHDSGIVMPADGRSYVLILLSANLEDSEAGVETLANVSKIIYDFHQNQDD